MNAMEGIQQLVFYLSAGMAPEEARDRFLVNDCGVPLESLAEGIDSTPEEIRNRVKEANSALQRALHTKYLLPDHPDWGLDDGRSLDEALDDIDTSSQDINQIVEERNAIYEEYHSVNNDE